MQPWEWGPLWRPDSTSKVGRLFPRLLDQLKGRCARLDEAQAGSKTDGRNITNLRYADNTTLMAEGEELKSLLKKVKEESEKLA